MGLTASRARTKRIHQGKQTSPVIQDKAAVRQRSLSIPSRSHDPLFVRTPPQSRRRPVSVHGDLFELETNVEEYSSIWNQEAKLSSPFQQLSRSNSRKFEPRQAESLDNVWSKTSAATFDSARVESTVHTQTHSDIHISSSEKFNELINHLSQIHTQLDHKTKRRTTQISDETTTLLLHILHETQQKQQRLLAYAKERQLEQEKAYQHILQDYVSQLNELKARELADLQRQLHSYRQELLEESQQKILSVNDQANQIKTKILHDEQHHASNRIESLVAQIQQLTADDKAQQLGSEIKTATNIVTNVRVGAPPSTFDFQRLQLTRNDRTHVAAATIRKLKAKE